MQEPKPVSGASAMGAWLSQLILWIKNWKVLSIEGYRAEVTSDGRNFKKSSLPFPLSASNLSGLNYLGQWYADDLIGRSFKKGDLIFMDGDGGINYGIVEISAVAHNGGSNYPVVFVNGGNFAQNLYTEVGWIVICTKDATINFDLQLTYTNLLGGFTGIGIPTVNSDAFVPFCVGRFISGVVENPP